MTGWDFLVHVLYAIVIAWGVVAVFFVALLITDTIRMRTARRYRAAKAWKEGYDAGVNDERKAAEWDIPEYRIPARQNPYGDPAKHRGEPDAHEPLQASR